MTRLWREKPTNKLTTPDTKYEGFNVLNFRFRTETKTRRRSFQAEVQKNVIIWFLVIVYLELEVLDDDYRLLKTLVSFKLHLKPLK